MTKQGSVKAVCVSEKKGERKKPVALVNLLEDCGIEGDAHAGQWHRQLSLLSAEDISLMKSKGLPGLKDGDFAENVVTSGVDLVDLGLGSRLRLGPEVEISITQIGKVCHTRCAIYEQTGDCIMPSRGLFARVLKGGVLQPGHEIEIVKQVPRSVFQCIVLTVSDRCCSGQATDTAGPEVARLLRSELGGNVYAEEILPDEKEQIEARLRHYSQGHSIDIILAVGGTGFAPRDVTPEAARTVIERFTPGLDEAMRRASFEKTPNAMLSRAVSGICRSTLIITLPGSERGAKENLEAILPVLGHGLEKLRGDPSDCGR